MAGIVPFPGCLLEPEGRLFSLVRDQFLASVQSAQEACFRFRMGTDCAARLGEEIYREGGFSHLLKASGATGGKVIGDSIRILGAKHPEQIKLPQVF